MSVGARRKYPAHLFTRMTIPLLIGYTLLKELRARRRTDDDTKYAGRFQEKSR